MDYLFAAAGVVWVGMFLYVLTFMRRQRQLQAEIADLRRTIEEWIN